MPSDESRLLPTGRFVHVDKSEWYGAIESLYTRMRARSTAGPYEVECNGLAICVLPDVYAPGFFTDSGWFASEVSQVVGGSTLLEIGTGTGVIAISCAKRGSSVIATDINPYAIRNAGINAQLHGVSISLRWGDVYEPLRQDEQVDFIFWAHPFNNWAHPVDDLLLRSGMDYKYEGLRRYIEGARTHLAQKGRLLLGTGDSADLKTMFSIAWSCGYRPELLTWAEMPLDDRRTQTIKYLLYELVSET